MASDSLNQIGRYLKRANKNADLSLKRNYRTLPKRERTRDVISSVSSFRMVVDTTEEGAPVTLNIKFNKPPPDDCSSECIATACEDFNVTTGGHSIRLVNPYVPGTVRVYSGAVELSAAQWYEENPSAGWVYVQVQNTSEIIAICYSYIIC